MNGLLLIDKPTGMSSFGVVARVRGILSRQAGNKIKIGHTGTLDPFATGLMLLVVGEYCKQAGEFSKLDKTYEATMCLGATSTTGDPEGELKPWSDRKPLAVELERVLKTFQGRIEQTPPIYSAIKINGKRAYQLARAGKTVEMPRRTVIVAELKLISYDYPFVRIACNVSSGTYIRSLVEDIGITLGIGAYTTELRRTRVGNYTVEDALKLTDLTGDLLQRSLLTSL